MLVDTEDTMELVSRDGRHRSQKIESRKEAARTARLEQRKLDRALNRLDADLSDTELRSDHPGFDDEIARFLQGRGDRTGLIESLADGSGIVIQIGELDDDSQEELIEDLDDKERQALEELDQDDQGGVAVPNQPLP